jgi:hypothetical protein
MRPGSVIAGQPAGEKLQHFSEFGSVSSVKPYFGHEGATISGSRTISAH